jgi:hypothetical protein
VADADDAAFAEMLRRLADSAGDDPLALDDDTAERLLAGDLDPADAPPGYAEVAVVLAAATAEPDPDELTGAAAAVAELAAVTRPGAAAARPARGPGRRRRTGLAVAVVVGALSMGGVAAAATGHLPEPIREAARDVLIRAGVATADPPAVQGRDAAEAGAAGGAGPEDQGAQPTGTTDHGGRRSRTAAPAGTGTNNGLCRAYLAGKGSRRGRNPDVAAFRALAAAAGGPDRIASWCQGTRPGGGTHRGNDQSAPPSTAGDHGQGPGGPPPGKGGGKQPGNGGPAGQRP